jgi:metallo-beta-lactamase family protein
LLKNIPVYIDSPLAAKATEVFRRSSYAFDDEAKEYLMRGDNPLSFKNLYFTHNAEESKALNFSDEPKIIISSSGMCEAGRIKHHLKHNLWKKNCSVIFVGYQAEGTLGRKIRDGAKNVKILGEDIHVNAEVYSVEGFSGHADKNGLIDWLRNFTVQPEKLFIVHGEPDAKAEFAKEVKETLGMDCIVPEYGQVYEIKGRTAIQGISSTAEHRVNFTAIRQTSQTDMQGTGTEEEKPLENTLSEETVKKLLEEIRSIKGLFEKSVDLIEGYIHLETATAADYNKIGNLLLNLESDLVNLTALGGK